MSVQLSDLAFRSKAHWGYSDEFMHQCRAELTYSRSDIERSLTSFLEIEKQLAGFYMLIPISQNVCELEALFVEPTEIGNGYGKKLINHAQKIAKNTGYKKIAIQSDPNSLAFYLAIGAVRTGSKPSSSIPGRNLPMLELAL